MSISLPDEFLRPPKYGDKFLDPLLDPLLLTRLSDEEDEPSLERIPSSYNPLHSFELAKGEHKGYKQQYADMYFLRLGMLKPSVEELAREAWSEFQVRDGTGETRLLLIADYVR